MSSEGVANEETFVGDMKSENPSNNNNNDAVGTSPKRNDDDTTAADDGINSTQKEQIPLDDLLEKEEQIEVGNIQSLSRNGAKRRKTFDELAALMREKVIVRVDISLPAVKLEHMVIHPEALRRRRACKKWRS